MQLMQVRIFFVVCVLGGEQFLVFLTEGDSVVEGAVGDLDYPAVIRSIGWIPLVDGRVIPEE